MIDKVNLESYQSKIILKKKKQLKITSYTFIGKVDLINLGGACPCVDKNHPYRLIYIIGKKSRRRHFKENIFVLNIDLPVITSRGLITSPEATSI